MRRCTTGLAGRLLALLLSVPPLAASGCGDSATMMGCRSDGDCGGGAACVAGTCRPTTGSADLSAPASDGGVPPDLATSTPPHDMALAGDSAAALCSFNSDGVIEASEAPFIVGLGALFAVNPQGQAVTVDLQPHAGVWDFSSPVPGERKVFDELLSPAGAWWAGDFPTATHAERIDDGQALWGVYRATATSLELLGVVSDTNGAQKTELTYATPIPVLQFPLSTTSHWTASSSVSGLAQGVFVATQDDYTFAVDARGTTRVPAGDFDTLRLRIDYKQTYGFLVTTRITYLHLAECYGAVARVRSQDDETNADFTQAAEYRRLSTP